MLGEGVQGTYGVESAELVGVMMTIGVRLLGGVGGLLSRMTGEVSSERTSPPSWSLRKSLIGIGRRGMGVMIPGGHCWSRKPSVESVVTVGAVLGASILCSGL